MSNLLNFDWKTTRSPGGAIIWVPTDESLHKVVPDAHVKGKFNPPVMNTADLALKYDPAYRKIAERFLADPEEYRLAFAKAWFKLTHRDMGPLDNYLGEEYPKQAHIWQDPVAKPTHTLVSESEVTELKAKILDTGLSVSELVKVAWGSASSYRDSDMRGGANGARIALAPQKDWAVNNPAETANTIAKLKQVQQDFNASTDGFFGSGAQISLADTIVLAGAAAIEKAVKDAGVFVTVPFVPGRGDATQAQTDVNSFNLLRSEADAFRNYYEKGYYKSPTDALVDKADQLGLTVPEMTVLLGGMRVLGANTDGSAHGVFTDNPGVLSNDFFVNLLDMSTKWQAAGDIYQGLDRKTGEVKYTATPVDLIFGSASELRAVAEVYAFDNSKQRFINDFVKAWAKVMQNDRFDIK